MFSTLQSHHEITAFAMFVIDTERNVEGAPVTWKQLCQKEKTFVCIQIMNNLQEVKKSDLNIEDS